MAAESKLGENTPEKTLGDSSSSSSLAKIETQKWPTNLISLILSELKLQWVIVLPLIVMLGSWFARVTITTAFLGKLGELALAGGALGTTISNVTCFAILNGLSAAMEPLCGQAFGAKNFKLLHKTLVMSIALQLVVILPLALLWLYVDKILILIGQREDIAMVAKKYLLFLLPELGIQALLCPLKSYLSTQSETLPILISAVIALAAHVPLNVFLSRSWGLKGVSMAIWMSDLVILIILALYVVIKEFRRGAKWKEGGWWEQGVQDWITLLKLCGPCCLTTCLEWWCYEILMLLSGRLPNPKQSVGALAIIMTFDYVIYSVTLPLSIGAAVRISNELGANQARRASQSAYISLGIATLSGILASSIMLAARGKWGGLFSHDKELVKTVKKILVIMAIMEIFNVPLVACNGIIRGIARPKLAMFSNLGGFYLLALPVGVILAFKVHFGVGGIVTSFPVGAMSSLLFMLAFILRIDWDKEARNAQILTSTPEKIADPEDVKNSPAANAVVAT